MSVELYYNNPDGAKIFEEIINNSSNSNKQLLLRCTSWMIIIYHIYQNTAFSNHNQKIKLLCQLQMFAENSMKNEKYRIITNEDIQKWSLYSHGFIQFVQGLGFKKNNNTLVLAINEFNIQKINTAISAINMTIIETSISNTQVNDWFHDINNSTTNTLVNANININVYQWQCTRCTLLNHVALSYCEICFCLRNNNNNYYNYKKDLDLDDDDDDEKNINMAEPSKPTNSWNECDRLNSATELYEKRKDLQSLTSLMAMVFEHNVTNFKKQNLQNLFKQDAIKELRILLDTLFNCKSDHDGSGLEQYIKSDDIQKTIDILIKYWNLFSKSNKIIKSKKNHIDIIIDLCFKWKKVLNKRQKLSNGETLEDKDFHFLKNVGKAFTEWFQCESDMKMIGKDWNDLLRALHCQEAFWTQKTGEINAAIENEEKKYAELAKQSPVAKYAWAKCFKYIAKVILYVSNVSSLVIGIVFGGGTADSIRRNVFNPAVKFFEEQSQEFVIDHHKLKQIQQLGSNAKMIEKTFVEMKKNSHKMDQFFSDFIIHLKQPMKKMRRIDKQMNRKHCNLIVIEENVKLMIQSFEELRKLCIEILQQIQRKMKVNPNDYTTKR